MGNPQALREYNDRLRFDLEQRDAEIKRLRDQCNQLDGLVEARDLQLEGAVGALRRIAFNGDWWSRDHAGPLARETLKDMGLYQDLLGGQS